MKKRWEIRKLGEICEYITKGTTPTSVGYQFLDEGINFIKVESLTEMGTIIPHKVAYISNACNEALKRSQLKSGDILFSIAGALGRTAIVPDHILPANTNQALAVIRLKHNVDILKEYILLALTSGYTTEQIQKFKGGVAQQNLSLEQIKNFEIPIPPLNKQQQIVSILDQAFTAIDRAKANVERNLQNAKDLFQSELNCIFSKKGDGWMEKRLEDLCDLKPQKKEARNKLTDNQLVTFLPMEDLGIHTKFFTPSKAKPINEVSGSYTYFADGDLLLAKITPCFENGKIGIARNLTNGIGFGSSEYLVFRTLGEVETELLYYFLSRNTFRQEGKPLMTGAVGHKRVSKDWIENHRVPFPRSIAEQKIIVSKLDLLKDNIQRMEALYNHKLIELENLKKSVLQKAFSGELKTTEPELAS